MVMASADLYLLYFVYRMCYCTPYVVEDDLKARSHDGHRINGEDHAGTVEYRRSLCHGPVDSPNQLHPPSFLPGHDDWPLGSLVKAGPAAKGANLLWFQAGRAHSISHSGTRVSVEYHFCRSQVPQRSTKVSGLSHRRRESHRLPQRHELMIGRRTRMWMLSRDLAFPLAPQ